MSFLLALLCIAASPLAAHAGQPAKPGASRVRTVVIEGLRFNPGRLVVSPGERIEWTNRDPFPHTVTASDGRFDSHAIPAGGSWTYVARKPGEYDYTCTFHPTMKGVIVVR
ncbi:MAG: cupredoxin domain-containing protein [Steroidobacteraceae bacterium]